MEEQIESQNITPRSIRDYVLLAAALMSLFAQLGLHFVDRNSVDPATIEKLQFEMSERQREVSNLQTVVEKLQSDKYEMHEKLVVLQRDVERLERNK